MDKIILGPSRRTRQDFQYYRQIKSHLNEIEGKRSKSMIKIAKAEVDPFPHQCRYYKPCQEIVNNPSYNYGHFKRVHPWTEDEQEFLLALFEESPNSKNVYILSALYGRSEDELRSFFKSQEKRIPKWSKKEKEIEDVHELINNQIQTLRTNNRVRLAKEAVDKKIDNYWEREATQVGLFTIEPASVETEAFTGLINPFPTNIKDIQSQDYLNPPNPIGSKDFYKNIVDALLEKHKYWIDEAQRLKNRILVLDAQIIELKNKLEEKMDEPELSTEELAEYNEQLNQIYQGF